MTHERPRTPPPTPGATPPANAPAVSDEAGAPGAPSARRAGRWFGGLAAAFLEGVRGPGRRVVARRESVAEGRLADGSRVVLRRTVVDEVEFEGPPPSPPR